MWNIIYNGQPVGPMTTEQLKAYGLTSNTMVKKEGTEQWVPAFNYPELMTLIQEGRANGFSSTGKDKTIAGILAIFLGYLGIHYFYSGKTTGGIITILLSAVTCGAWSIITLIQGILMLTMSQAEYEQKYVLNDKTFPLF